MNQVVGEEIINFSWWRGWRDDGGRVMTHSKSSAYINWSSLSLQTPRMRKANESCMVSAARPLVKQHSYRLVRFCSCLYVTKGEMLIGRPPLCDDRRNLRGGRLSLFSVSSSKIAVFRNVVAQS